MYSIADLMNSLNKPKPAGASLKIGDTGDISDLMSQMDSLYKVEKQNWYTAKPYGFKTTTRDNKEFTMFLPISPSNLTINTNFATNVVTTLYGTIEEHSDVRYFDITIEGTTGFAPKFVEPGEGKEASTLYLNLYNSGRSTAAVAETISAGGFFAKTLGAINQIKNKAVDLLEGGPKAKTGIHVNESGYAAFHNLYRFLLQYKKDAAGVSSQTDRQSHPLIFFNYKDNNQYNVSVRSFTMRRDANNPMLYNYSIQLRGYNLKNIEKSVNEDLGQRYADLGLNGVDGSSVLGNIKSLSGQAKSIIGSAVGGISVLGR